MTTIKLKDTQNNKEEVFSAGQWLKDEYGIPFIICRPEPNRLALVGIEKNDSYEFGAMTEDTSWFNSDKATITYMNGLFNRKFTPISVTISED